MFSVEIGEDWEMSRPNSSPIRVMRIIARMNIGGPAVQVTGLMRGLDATSFDQRLYTGFCSIHESDYLEKVAPDITCFRIDGFGRRVNFVGDLKALTSLIREIRRFRPHVIHTHTAKAGFLGRVASVVSMHSSIRVHTFHGHLLDGYFGPIKRMLVVLAERLLAVPTHQLLSVGDKVRKDLLREKIGTKDKFALMPPGLELSKLYSKMDSRTLLGVSNYRLQCAFIGRVTKVKRPDRFLDVVGELKSRGVEIDFMIAGDGELLNSCRERIAREALPISVLGWQNSIEKVLSAADMVVLTSDNEGTPLSLIQAGMAGIPVVTTDVGSVSEVVLDGISGIVTSLDTLKIADAIEKLVMDKDLRAQLGAAAQEFTTANFGILRLVKDHEDLYRRLLSNPTKS